MLWVSSSTSAYNSIRCAIKLDMHKAFDSLNWSFLLTALNCMGFPWIFKNWLEKCFTTAMLICHCDENFSACIKKHTEAANFRFHWRTDQVQVTHLIFADDVIMFTRDDIDFIKTLSKGVEKFSSLIGLSPECW